MRIRGQEEEAGGRVQEGKFGERWTTGLEHVAKLSRMERQNSPGGNIP